MRAIRLAAAAACTATLAAAAPAAANGRFPASSQILVDPTDRSHLALRATFGVLRSRDAGASWGWICEGAIGYGGQEDPMLAVPADGSLLAAVYAGLSASRDDGCSWSLGQGPIAGLVAVDLAVPATSPHEVLLLAADLGGGSGYAAKVFHSDDDGKTFTPLGADLPPAFVAVTVDAAPSAPSTIYVSGKFGPPDDAASLLRTTDGGVTWDRLDVPGVSGRFPYIAAVAPGDAQTLYVRVDDLPGDSLLVTHDGGVTWTSIFQGEGDLLAFALSPDGVELVVGGDTDGLWRADAAALSFTQVQTLTTRCAAWGADGLYACADEIADGFSLALSTDSGETFSPLLHLHDVCGPLACPASTSVGEACGDAWTALAPRLAASACAPAGDSGSTGGSPPARAGGCGCRAASSSPSNLAWVGAAGALLVAWARRGRRFTKAGAQARAAWMRFTSSGTAVKRSATRP